MIARLAYAAGRQGKFAQAHRNLIDNYRVVDDAYVEGFAEALDLDLQQLIQDMQDQDVADTLEENVKTLVRIGSVSIPTLLIGGKFVYSPGEKNNTSDTLMDLFNQARGL